MSESKKGNSGCLRTLALLAGLMVGACILYLIIVLPINRQFKDDSPPQPTSIPVSYDEALADARQELSQNMATMAILLQDADAGRPDTRAAILMAVGSYGKLSNLDYPPGRAQEHANTVESLSGCGESSKWFNNAYSTQDIATYNHAIEQGWLWFDECRAKLGF